MMLQLFLTAKSNVTGARAASQMGGWGFCSGLGTEVALGNCQNSPLWAQSPCHSAFTTGSIS